MRYELWLGLRYLFGKRRERFISVSATLSILGVALGVMALITIIAVMSGFRRDYTEKLIGVNAHLIVDAPDGVRDTDQLLRQLSAMDHVVGVSPFITGQAVLDRSKDRLGVLVRGIDAAREPRVSRLADYVIVGALPQQDDDVLIGIQLSAYLDAVVGDPLEVTSPLDGKTRELIVSGVFRSGLYENDAFLVGVTLPRAQELFHLEGVVSGVSVKLDELERSDAMKHAIQEEVGGVYTVRTWTELNPALFGALRIEKIVMFVIATLIILVAALNIMSMLTMIVMEKTKEIGILRALGATRLSVALLFLFQGCFIGLLGIGLGFIGGLTLTVNLDSIVRWLEDTFGFSLFPSSVYYLDHIPAQIDAFDVSMILGVAFVLVVLAGTYTAIRAARLTPVDALRNE